MATAALPSLPKSSSPESPPKTFQRFKSSFGQRLGTATRSRKTTNNADDITSPDKGKESDKEQQQPKFSILRRVIRRPAPPPSPQSPHKPPFATLRQASLSSPAVHLLGSPTPSSSRPIPFAIPDASTREPSSSPPPKSASRHRSTKSHPLTSPSTPSLALDPQPRLQPRRPPIATPPSPIPRASSPNSPTVRTRARSPTVRVLTPPSPIRPSRNPSASPSAPGSKSTSYLPLSGSPISPPTSQRRTSLEPRRVSADNPVSDPPPPSPPTRRALPTRGRESPSPAPTHSIRPRATSPQNRHFNISSGSHQPPSLSQSSRSKTHLPLLSQTPSLPSRALIRRAIVLVCRETAQKPVGTNSVNINLGKDWDGVELRTKTLLRIEKAWRSSLDSNLGIGSGGREGTRRGSIDLVRTGVASTEEKERRVFLDALRDGYVLCQMMNKLRQSSIVRPDPNTSTSAASANVTKFLAACASYGMTSEDIFLREDLLDYPSGADEVQVRAATRVARTIIRLVEFVEEEGEREKGKWIRGGGQGKGAETEKEREKANSSIAVPHGHVQSPIQSQNTSASPSSVSRSGNKPASLSTPNLLSSPSSPSRVYAAAKPQSSNVGATSPVRKRWTPPQALPPLRSSSPYQDDEDDEEEGKGSPGSGSSGSGSGLGGDEERQRREDFYTGHERDVEGSDVDRTARGLRFRVPAEGRVQERKRDVFGSSPNLIGGSRARAGGGVKPSPSIAIKSSPPSHPKAHASSQSRSRVNLPATDFNDSDEDSDPDGEVKFSRSHLNLDDNDDYEFEFDEDMKKHDRHAINNDRRKNDINYNDHEHINHEERARERENIREYATFKPIKVPTIRPAPPPRSLLRQQHDKQKMQLDEQRVKEDLEKREAFISTPTTHQQQGHRVRKDSMPTSPVSPARKKADQPPPDASRSASPLFPWARRAAQTSPSVALSLSTSTGVTVPMSESSSMGNTTATAKTTLSSSTSMDDVDISPPMRPWMRDSVADSTRASIGDESFLEMPSSPNPHNININRSPGPGQGYLNRNYSPTRQSYASSALSETDTTLTSGFSNLSLAHGRVYSGEPLGSSPPRGGLAISTSSGGKGGPPNFGTIRTVTTDLTSEAPSMFGFGAEGAKSTASIAEELEELDGMRQRVRERALSGDLGVAGGIAPGSSPGKSMCGGKMGISSGNAAKIYGILTSVAGGAGGGGRDRKMSERNVKSLDLARVAELEENTSVESHGGSGGGGGSSKGSDRPAQQQQQQKASPKSGAAAAKNWKDKALPIPGAGKDEKERHAMSENANLQARQHSPRSWTPQSPTQSSSSHTSASQALVNPNVIRKPKRDNDLIDSQPITARNSPTRQLQQQQQRQLQQSQNQRATRQQQMLQEEEHRSAASSPVSISGGSASPSAASASPSAATNTKPKLSISPPRKLAIVVSDAEPRSSSPVASSAVPRRPSVTHRPRHNIDIVPNSSGSAGSSAPGSTSSPSPIPSRSRMNASPVPSGSGSGIVPTPTASLFPKEKVWRREREGSPDDSLLSVSGNSASAYSAISASAATAPISVASQSRVLIRRSTGGVQPNRQAAAASSAAGNSANTSTPATAPIPFPRSVSAASGGAASPSPRSSLDAFRDRELNRDREKGRERDRDTSRERPRIIRGRFQSDIESSNSRRLNYARASSFDELEGIRDINKNSNNSNNGGDGVPSRLAPRSRIESMVNLGVAASGSNTSASDLLNRELSVNLNDDEGQSNAGGQRGSAARMRLVVREEGKPPTHYQLGNCIGRGQFGSVYRALNLNTGQMVAVKRIRLEGLKEEEVTTLMWEVDLVKSLSHPSIVKYEGVARDEDTLNIVLEYVENGSLGQTLKAFGKFNEKLVASYVVKILEGLHYLHTCEVVHCDLKAANILTTKNGNVKLSDFGVSLNLRAMERGIKDVAGTPNWMAPEVIELKGASTKSDIWSLGCTVIELLTGRPPYAEMGNGMSVMFRIVEDDMPPIPEGSSEMLRDFLEQCFDKDPNRRPSAEMLCEHPWLKNNWVALQGLRPQDSIPFLRRVSTDLHKSDAVRFFSQLDLQEPPSPGSPIRDDKTPTPMGRRISNSSVRPNDNDFSPREHTFVKTTFSKPMVCRVCLANVKKTAVLCSQCSLISHSKCAVNAPPTCDLRAQLLLYAQYAEKGNPASVYSNPAVAVGDKDKVAMSDVAFVEHPSPRTSIDSSQPPPRSPTALLNYPEHVPTAFKIMAALRRSRANLTPEANASATSSSPPKRVDEPPVKRRVLQKRSERPQSITSVSTGLSSLRSAATAAESFSSHKQSEPRPPPAPEKSRKHNLKSDGAIVDRGKSTKIKVSTRSDTANNFDDRELPGEDPQKNKKQHPKSSSTNCAVQ